MAERRKSYAEQLKDPRWQKKRLRKMSALARTFYRQSVSVADEGVFLPCNPVWWSISFTRPRVSKQEAVTAVNEILDAGLMRYDVSEECFILIDPIVVKSKRKVHPVRAELARLYATLAPMILERDGRMCRYCGATDRLSIDHIVPIASGGTNDESNLAAACKRCNSRKQALHVDVFMLKIAQSG